jgi:fatty acid desaturase
MITNPVFILAVIALILAIVSYWPGAPTLGVAVILLAVALMLSVGKVVH